MFFRSDRGRRRPHLPLICDAEEPIRLDEARLGAWAMAVGHDRGYFGKPSRRPHRGMLPDVDFSRAVPAPRRQGLFARLFRLFAGRQRNQAAPAGAGESGAGDRALGEAERKAYVWVLEWESDAAKPGAPAHLNDRSRAA